MISHKQALKILKEKRIEGKVLRHSLKVNQIAMFLGKKLSSKGENVNLELLDAASLLHDVGKKLSDDTGKNHIETGVKILQDRGLTEIAEVIRKHSINAIVEKDKIPQTWEEKLVYYADKRVREDKIVSLDERMADLRKRYPNLRKPLTNIIPKIKAIEEEIFNIVEINKRLKEIS
ncbi:HD domain-containing protein [Thioalkalivibrio sp.]|uniref:HD domain-containing protein n=1 Tax=Thioalkalivibrio sp. TaxID=2093813 RepID=UPI003976AF25